MAVAARNVMNKARFFATTLMFVIWSITINQIWILLPLFQFFSANKAWRTLVNHVQRMWAHAIFLMFGRMKLVLHGEPLSASSRPKIIIANHTSDVDWVLLWMLSAVNKDFDRAGNVKIMLKDAIKHVPIMGWGCKLFGFVFLKRNWAEDQITIEKQVSDLIKDDLPLWLIIFPEGTTVNTKYLAKAHEFAKGTGRPDNLQHTLLPRSKGLEALIEVMQKHGKNPEIVDVTVVYDGYSGEIPTFEMGYERNIDKTIPNGRTLFSGEAGDITNMDIRHFDGQTVLKHPKGVQGWLDERFVRKNKIMEAFSKTHKMPMKECGNGQLNKFESQFSTLAPLLAMALLPTTAAFMGLRWLRGY